MQIMFSSCHGGRRSASADRRPKPGGREHLHPSGPPGALRTAAHYLLHGQRELLPGDPQQGHTAGSADWKVGLHRVLSSGWHHGKGESCGCRVFMWVESEFKETIQPSPRLYSSHVHTQYTCACTRINMYHPALPLGADAGHSFLSAGYHRVGPSGFGRSLQAEWGRSRRLFQEV